MFVIPRRTNIALLAASGLLACVAAPLPLTAGEVLARSGSGQTTLAELYTSEGCSSCPPADRWFSKFATDSGLWKEFVPVAFHVDYWDRLGWKDRFASSAFTTRQYAYASAWRSESVYTPETVINGRDWKWSTGAGLPMSQSHAAGLLELRRDGGQQIELVFTPPGGAVAEVSESYDAYFTLLGNGFTVKVTAGENEGHELRHPFVALDLQQLPATGSAGDSRSMRAVFSMPKIPPADGIRYAIAAWVCRHGELTPLQATGAWLAAYPFAVTAPSQPAIVGIPATQ